MSAGRRLLLAAVLVLAGAAPAAAQSEIVEYYGLDQVGSVRVVFDASGAIMGRMDYGPFGQSLSGGTAMPDRMYAGLFRDGEVELDAAGARSYQVRTGRFSTVDPVYAGLFEPQRWNRYAYALNNPVSFTDATGLLVAGPSNFTCDNPAAWAELHCSFWSAYDWLNSLDPGGGGYVRGSSGEWGRGIVRPGTTGTDTDTSTDDGDQPTNGTPPGNPPNPPKPKDDCHRFVDTLVGMSQVAMLDPDGTGVAMMIYANQKPDPWHKNPQEGFRPTLLVGQGPDVYRHLFAYSGAALAVNSVGPAAAAWEMSKDIWQFLSSKEGARTELIDDFAGLAAGAVMRVGGLFPGWTGRQVSRIICK